jgi:hypothetical protein
MFSAGTEQHVEDENKLDERPTYIETKTPFRFPLISDEEKDGFLGDESITIK